MPNVTWDPLVQPTAEDDLILYGDLTSLSSLQGDGGYLCGPGNISQSDLAAGFEFGSGKFSGAVRAVPGASPSATHITYPIDGLVKGDQFTVAAWMKHPTTAWEALTNKNLMSLRALSYYIYFGIEGTSGQFILYAETLGSAPAGTPGRASVATTGALGSLPAGTWHHLAFSFRQNQLRAYINGVQVGNALTLTTLPDNLTDEASSTGIMLGGTFGNPSGLWVSDPVVYRTGRLPGVAVAQKLLSGTATIDTASNAGTNDRWRLGTLHPPLKTGGNAAQVGAAVKLMRTDKFINSSPIKIGAPDVTHPTLGYSGTHSWDFQVVDRTVNEIVRLGAKLYISVDCAPQIYGGPPPYQPGGNPDLNSDITHISGYSYTPPNNAAGWKDLVKDLVHRIVVDLGAEVPLWTFWNEPEIGTWAGTMDEYIDFYKITVEAIREIDPNARVGAPEMGSGGSQLNTTWINRIFERCAAENIPLQFVAYHDYSGDLAQYRESNAIVNYYANLHGFTTPFPLVVGEHNWSVRNVHSPSPQAIFTDDFLHIKAFGAAYLTAAVCNMLAYPNFLGYAFAHLNSYSGNPRSGGFDTMQLIGLPDPSTTIAPQWAPYNAMKGLQMVLGDRRLAFTADLPPGVYMYAGKDTATGRIGFVLTSYGWANRADRSVDINLSGLVGDSCRVRRYLVDPTHSSRWDTHEDDPAGAVDQELALMSDTTGAAPTTLNLTVPQWGSLFVTIDGGAVGSTPDPVPRIVKLGGQLVKLGA
jgi:hypothetical protein